MQDGATPLYCAANMGYLSVVQALLKFGCEIDKPLQDGATPLFVAAANGNLEIV